MSSGSKEILDTAQSIAERICDQDYSDALIISHIDADGLTAASIASIALTREQIKHDIKFIKQLDDKIISELHQVQQNNDGIKRGKSNTLFWFTDLGSGMSKEINQFKPIITDHHAPSIQNYDVPVKARTDLLEFSTVIEHQLDEYHLNPHLFNLDGTHDISGAGTVYLVARAINKKNTDLAHLAVIGAVGDVQDSKFRHLTGSNRKILVDAETAGKIKTIIDISSFGRETRSLPSLIQYSTDPYFPGLTLKEANCVKFFKKLEIPLKTNGQKRHWVDLNDDERQTIISELMELMLSKGIGHKNAKRLLCEVYVLPEETMGTTLHDVKEFATLLNSCGKYNKPEIGYDICLGDRSEKLTQAYQLLKGHKSILVEGMHFVRDKGIIDYELIQYFDAGDRVPENVVGTIAGMLLGNNDADNNKPIFGFAMADDSGSIKVSGRTTREMVTKGVNLSKIMKEISDTLGAGSVGGGHDIAAGATIPIGKQQEFLKYANQIIKKQLGV